MKRERYSTGTLWKPVVGYSRAVRAGPFVFVPGTTATTEDGSIVGQGDPYPQAIQALKNIEAALIKLGASLQELRPQALLAAYLHQGPPSCPAELPEGGLRRLQGTNKRKR